MDNEYNSEWETSLGESGLWLDGYLLLFVVLSPN